MKIMSGSWDLERHGLSMCENIHTWVKLPALQVTSERCKDHGQWLVLRVRALPTLSHGQGGHIATRFEERIVKFLFLFAL
jgi:hypothetical protein